MYRSAGIIDKYERVAKWRQFQAKNSLSEDGWNSVGIKNIAPIFKILTLFYIIAIIILFLEYLFKSLRKFWEKIRGGNRKKYWVEPRVKKKFSYKAEIPKCKVNAEI